ncbi:hypothetical protein LPB67_11745 [Undibacterium sp. Jales W-56]|uniref:hypothetical protein n=1 Tax=Undibacterium sp. Jales W-56 TaxID=2897325 RepID=UPI0021CF550B|nr:hypothetical protein [Undibacterium sp. Jales W-56]MCU6434445.1 hypothetical protein [Undibacterium sp. Jales W-56]
MAEFLVGFITVFESVLLIVTEAFNGADCGLSAFLPTAPSVVRLTASLDLRSAAATGFAFLLIITSLPGAFTPDLVSFFTLALALGLAAGALAGLCFETGFITLGALMSFATSFLAGTFATTLLAGTLALMVLTASFLGEALAISFAGATLATTFFAAEDVGVFAGFFIALAIESNLPEQRWRPVSYKKTILKRRIIGFAATSIILFYVRPPESQRQCFGLLGGALCSPKQHILNQQKSASHRMKQPKTLNRKLLIISRAPT